MSPQPQSGDNYFNESASPCTAKMTIYGAETNLPYKHITFFCSDKAGPSQEVMRGQEGTSIGPDKGAAGFGNPKFSFAFRLIIRQ